MSLRNKFLLIFLLISLIPLISLGIISFNVSATIIEEAEIKKRLQRLDVISEEVFKIIQEKHILGILLAYHPDVLDFFHGLKEEPILEKKKNELDIQKLLLSHFNLNKVQSFNLVSHDNRIVSSKEYPELSQINISEDELQKKKEEHLIPFFNLDGFDFSGEYLIPFIRIISGSSLDTRAGIFIVNFRESFLSSFYRKYGDIGAYCITDRNHIILSHTDTAFIGSSFLDAYEIDSDQKFDGEGFFKLRINGEKFLIMFREDKSYHWKYYSVINVRDMIGGVNYIKRLTLLLSLLFGLITIILAFTLSRSLILPINDLISIMKEVEDGQMNLENVPKYNNEIGMISRSFERMIKKLNASIEEKLKIQKEKREAELRVLEFQINPHFLYNTLSSIIWLVDPEKNKDVVKITQALSDMFRISISRGKEVIQISEELTHVKSYIEIEQVRYKGEFVVLYDIDVEIYNYRTIKLILQPIVENAIYHGILNNKNGDGILKLEGVLQDNCVVFRIYDNGCCINEERIIMINDFLKGKTEQDENFGIGIRNVNDRIRLMYGPEYGLNFKVCEQFTVVEIRIPAELKV